MKNLIFILLITIMSCKDDVQEPDCMRVPFSGRWEEIEKEIDSTSKHFGKSILKIRLDRNFTTIKGKDCPPGRAGIATECVSGNSYVFNLLDDSMIVYMTYNPNVSGVYTYHLRPKDSVAIINDPNICLKSGPSFIFLYP